MELGLGVACRVCETKNPAAQAMRPESPLELLGVGNLKPGPCI